MSKKGSNPPPPWGYPDRPPPRPAWPSPGALHDPPRTLEQIIDAVRLGESVSLLECRQAVAALDVFIQQSGAVSDVAAVEEFNAALVAAPMWLLGEANDPDNAEAQAWYRAMSVIP